MADEEATQEGPASARRPTGNKTIWAVIAALVLIFIIGAIVVSSKKTSNTAAQVNAGSRAVLVATADEARTVVVPPCGTGAATPSDPAKLRQTSGTILFTLPKGEGTRVVVVPRCGGGRGAQGGTSNLPSSAFVLRANAPLPALHPGSSAFGTSQAGDPNGASGQLSVPQNSPVKTIVVSACESSSIKGPAQRVLTGQGGGSTAVAPPC